MANTDTMSGPPMVAWQEVDRFAFTNSRYRINLKRTEDFS